jgi:hypothetical protein
MLGAAATQMFGMTGWVSIFFLSRAVEGVDAAAGCLHDQWRVELLQNVSVPLQQHCEELQDIVRHEVHLDRAAKAGELDRFALRQKAHGFPRRQNMDTSEIVVRIGRWESIEMRPADRCEQKWVCVALHFGAQQVVVDHKPYSEPAAIRRALIRNAFAR